MARKRKKQQSIEKLKVKEKKGESQWFSWRRYSYFRIPLSPWCIHGVPAVLLSYPVYEAC